MRHIILLVKWFNIRKGVCIQTIPGRNQQKPAMVMKSSYWYLSNWELPYLDWRKLLNKSSTPSGVGGMAIPGPIW